MMTMVDDGADDDDVTVKVDRCGQQLLFSNMNSVFSAWLIFKLHMFFAQCSSHCFSRYCLH